MTSNYGCPWSSTMLLQRHRFCCCRKVTASASAGRNPKLKLASVPWNYGVVGSTMTIYLSGIHVPLSFSGLSVVSSMLSVEGRHVKAISLAVLQTAELCGALWLIRSSIAQFGTELVDMNFDQLLGGRRAGLLATVTVLASLTLSTLTSPSSLVSSPYFFLLCLTLLPCRPGDASWRSSAEGAFAGWRSVAPCHRNGLLRYHPAAGGIGVQGIPSYISGHVCVTSMCDRHQCLGFLSGALPITRADATTVSGWLHSGGYICKDWRLGRFSRNPLSLQFIHRVLYTGGLTSSHLWRTW